jgi:hypothetical protein
MKMNAQYASMQCRGTTKRRRKASTNVFVTHRFYALFCLFLYFNQSDHQYLSGALGGKVTEEMAAMKLSLDEIKIGMKFNPAAQKGFTTTAQLWQHGVRVNAISLQDEDFSKSLCELADRRTDGPIWLRYGDIPACLKGFVANKRTPEKDVTIKVDKRSTTMEGTQAHFTRAMEAILGTMPGAPAAMRASFHRRMVNGKGYIQKAVTKNLGCVPDAVAHKAAKSFLLRKPDTVFYDHRSIRATARIVFFGNLKGHSGSYFPDSEKGEILDFAMDFLLHVQPERPFVIVFLTNTRGFQYFKVMRDAAHGFATKESEFYDAAEDDQLGWQVSSHGAVL